MQVMVNSAFKVRTSGNPNVMVCERGTMFGYSKSNMSYAWSCYSRLSKCLCQMLLLTVQLNKTTQPVHLQTTSLWIREISSG